jgi:zinc transport system substrate-binding protein
MNDYRIECYAAFPGWCSETEASFKTVTYLAALVDEINLSSVIVLENTELRLAETVIASTKEKDARIVRMDSMQSISQNDIKQGVTYLEIMKNNLEALSLALYGSDEE